MNRIKLAVVGSRNITDYRLIKRYGLPALMMMGVGPNRIETIVSGGAKGVDTLAEQLANDLWIEQPIIHQPEWKRHGKKAGFLRNQLIVDDCDAALVVWDGDSKGTYDTMSKLAEARKAYIMIRVLVLENPHEEIINDITFVTEPRWRELYENKVHPERSSRNSRATRRSSSSGPRRR